jgi:radical SAM protein with 4Fe4S-binding SPASM domain
MILCVDGYNQETVNRYRVGTDWETLLRNLGTIGRVKTDCIRSMRVLMFKYNDGHEDFYRRLARKHNITAINFVSPVIHSKDAGTWLSDNPKYQRYRYKDGEWKVKRVPRCTENVLNGSSLIVSVHGHLYPCCFDQNLDHPLGHVLDDSWEDLMENFAALKPRMLKRELPMCRSCVIPSDKIYHWETP